MRNHGSASETLAIGHEQDGRSLQLASGLKATSERDARTTLTPQN